MTRLTGLVFLALTCATARAHGVKVSERFGYDKEDSTRFLQAALDSDEPEIVLDRQAGPWIATPLVCRKPKTVRFEDGVWLVAKRGAFANATDTLLKFEVCRDVKVLGPGPERCGLRMWREDYANTNLYSRSEHRMGLSVISCADVRIEGISVRESGGDGLYVSNRGRNSEPCRNVTVRNCVFDRNLRQGVSVISVDGLLMEDVVMSNTRGMPPEAGIDFEPNAKGEMLANIVLRRCRTEGNAGCGYAFAPNYLDSESRKVTAVFEDCVSVGDGFNAVNYSAAFRQRPGFDAEIPNDDYDIAFRRCRFERSGREAVFVFTKALSCGRFAFEDCTVVNCGTGMPEKADFCVSVTGHEGYAPNAVTLDNVTIHQSHPRPWIAFFGDPEKPFRGEPTRVSGSVTVRTEGKSETYALDEAWRAANTPFTPCAKQMPVRRVAASLADVRILDAKPGEAVSCAPVFVQTTRFRRPMSFYVFYARKEQRVNLTAFVRSGGKKDVRGRVLVSRFGDGTNTMWSTSLKFGKRTLAFDVPETGFYSLGLLAPNTEFAILSTDVPMALDVTQGQVRIIGLREPFPGYDGGKLCFWIPSGVPTVTVSCYGSGAEALDAQVLAPDGSVAFSYPRKIGPRTAYLSAPAAGLWSIEMCPPRKSARESHWLSLNGVPGWYFLSAEKTWTTERN